MSALKRLAVPLSSNAFPLVELTAPAPLRAAHTSSSSRGDVIFIQLIFASLILMPRRTGGGWRRSEHGTFVSDGGEVTSDGRRHGRCRHTASVALLQASAGAGASRHRVNILQAWNARRAGASWKAVVVQHVWPGARINTSETFRAASWGPSPAHLETKKMVPLVLNEAVFCKVGRLAFTR